MRKLESFGTALTRSQMKNISPGGGMVKSLVGSDGCDSTCSSNSDCDCNPCGSGGGSMYCASLSCGVLSDGVYNKSYKKCSCGGNY